MSRVSGICGKLSLFVRINMGKQGIGHGRDAAEEGSLGTHWTPAQTCFQLNDRTFQQMKMG